MKVFRFVISSTKTIYNEDKVAIPTSVATGANVEYIGENRWPINDMGYMVFNFVVDHCASDIATEIITGWWNDNFLGCKFCSQDLVNKWGHWSHSIEFRLDKNAT